MQNVHKIKQDICDIGKRIYNRQFAAANDGNITVRVSENEVLCTPTLHCKGFLKPDDISTVDMTGKQISGRKKRSSEALLHLEIYKQRRTSRVLFTVIRHMRLPSRLLASRSLSASCRKSKCFWVMCRSRNTKRRVAKSFADTIIPFVNRTNVMILANHGTVSYGESVEQAYWWTEILDSYCRMLMLAKQLGNVSFLSGQKSQELLDLKEQWGYQGSSQHVGVRKL